MKSGARVHIPSTPTTAIADPPIFSEDSSLARRAVALALEAIVALAQGALAWVLGALARALANGSQAAAIGTGMTPMSRSALERLAPLTLGARHALGLAIVGLALVTVRGAAWAWLAGREVREGAYAAGAARGKLLRAALGGRVEAPSLGAAIAWPTAVEQGVRAARARRRAMVQLVVLAAVTIAIDPLLSLIVVATIVPFAMMLRPVRRALRSMHVEATRGAAETIDAVRDVVEHATIWASCGAERTATARVAILTGEASALSSRAAVGQALASSSNEALAAVAVVVLVAAFAPTRPTLVPVLVALVSAYRPIRDLAEAAGARARATAARESLEHLPSPSTESARVENWIAAPLELRGVALDVGAARAREGVDLVVRPGEIAAIVGAPGTGKSALLEAIAGARTIARGSILFGARAIHDAPIGPAHRPVAWVPPSPPVLPGTLAENLSPDAPHDRDRVARAREILRGLGDEELRALPDDARLGARGRRVSSGEAQRIALARALASDAKVILLDEPTASLDARGERAAIDCIAEATTDRVVVMVTHRPAPLEIARCVLSLDEEPVRASGAREAS